MTTGENKMSNNLLDFHKLENANRKIANDINHIKNECLNICGVPKYLFDNKPPMKIIYNNIIPFRGFKAINLFGVLFVRKNSVMTASDMTHERIHTVQMKEMLYLFFYLWYVVEWLIKLVVYLNSHMAYRNISFEREAYSNQYRTTYLDYRKHYAWWKYTRKRNEK